MIEFEKIHFDSKLIFAVLNGKVSAEVSKKLSSDLKSEGIDLTPEQMTVLFNLFRKEHVTQQDLCAATFKDKPSMTRLIDNLEMKGYVKRTLDRNDRRSNLITMTEKGSEIEEKAFRVANRTFKNVLKSVSEQELILTQELLRTILENIRNDHVESPSL